MESTLPPLVVWDHLAAGKDIAMRWPEPDELSCDEPGCARQARWLILEVMEKAPAGRERAWAFSESIQTCCERHTRGPRLPRGPLRA
jgi:hypothetical protein